MKQLSIIILVWLAPASVNANPDLSLAFKGGPNAATLAKDYRVNRYGFSGGIAGDLQWRFVDRFLLAGQIDLLYVPRGADVIFDGEFQGNSRYHYFDIMIAARPEVQFSRASIYLLLGGGLNLLVSANNRNPAGIPQDITHNLHRVDVALLAGAGVALHLPRRGLGAFRLGTVFLEARHDYGLIDIDLMNGGFRNRTTSLMLGLSFALTSRAASTQPTSPPARSDPPSPGPPPVPAND